MWTKKTRGYQCPICGKSGAFVWFTHKKKCTARHNFPYSLGKYWKDTVQPYNGDGSVNKLFIKIYGTKAYDTLEKK